MCNKLQLAVSSVAFNRIVVKAGGSNNCGPPCLQVLVTNICCCCITVHSSWLPDSGLHAHCLLHLVATDSILPSSGHKH